MGRADHPRREKAKKVHLREYLHLEKCTSGAESTMRIVSSDFTVILISAVAEINSGRDIFRRLCRRVVN